MSTHGVPYRHGRTRATRRLAVLLCALVLGVPVLLGGPTGAADGSPTGKAEAFAAPQGPGSRPNIVLITTDDQRLDDLDFMPRTRRLLGRAGVTLDNALSPHPLCCPARVQILTGQYAHNNGVRHNGGPWGGFQAFARTPARRLHLGTRLQDDGYRTGLVGKFLNGYESVDTVQPGWTAWNPLLEGVYRYSDFVLRVDGRNRRYSLSTDPRNHVTDVIGRRAVTLARRWAGPRPFFLWISHVAPHDRLHDGRFVQPLPAPRHAGLFPDTPLPVATQPNFMEADLSDKPGAVGASPRFDRRHFVSWFRHRIRSLQAVDEANAALVRALADTGELSRTLIVFTSDNGYLLGEHWLGGKNWVYEPALRVPMLLRGPGLPAGRHRAPTATLVDLAPTFLALAGAPRPGMDGRNLFPMLSVGRQTTDTDLVQAGSDVHPWRWRGVRTSRYSYAEWGFGGDQELYDRQLDPFQLQNLLRPGSGELLDESYEAVLADLRSRLAQRSGCAGAECRTNLGPDLSPTG